MVQKQKRVAADLDSELGTGFSECFNSEFRREDYIGVKIERGIQFFLLFIHFASLRKRCMANKLFCFVTFN